MQDNDREGRWTTISINVMNMPKLDQPLLDKLVQESKPYCKYGKVADYIPELARTDRDILGITVHSLDGRIFTSQCEHLFSLQSISKVFSLIVALMDVGEQQVFSRVGMEPTGEDYNSILKLELDDLGMPFNPFINAGAITVSSLIKGTNPRNRAERVLELVRMCCGNDQSIQFNEQLFQSEFETAFRNRSLAYFLKDNKMLEGDVEDHLTVYTLHCAIEVNCTQLAQIAAVLANDGKDVQSGKEIIPKRYVQIVRALMVTCGMYNASGEFAIKVGLPAKSGVSGGIMAVVPGRYGIGVIGPALDEKGNSVAGVQLLWRLSEACSLNMF